MVLIRDCVSSFVASLNQSSKARKKITVVRYSNIINNICSLLYKKGYIVNYKIIENNYIVVQSKYHNNLPVISVIERISRPGRRVFMSNNQLKDLHKYILGNSVYVVSTSAGIYTAKDCILRGLAGELLFKIN